MSAAPVVLGITIRADGSAQVTGEINRVQTAVSGAGTAAQNSSREFARMAASMDSAVQAAAAVNARLASATAIYDNQVARLTMTTQAYRAYQLQLDGLHPSQIRHIQDLEAAQAAVTRTSTSMSGLSSVLSAFGLTLGLVGLAGLAKDILDTNRSMESLRAQLLALTGSAEQAQQTFDFITKFAVNTPFEIQGLTKAFITLQNYGLTPTTEVMQAITDQAAKLGGKTENLQGITLALGQAWGKGKLQGQEILQMVDQGVPVWDLLTKVTGKNVAELQKMSASGEITRDVIDKLIKKMGEMATGSNAAAMDTLNGKISNLADAWHQFEDALLQSKAEGVIKDIVNSITNTLNILTNQLGSTIDNQIAHAKARIDTFNSMGSVGSFVSDISGYDINAEKNKLDSLIRIKQTQDEAAAIKAKTDEAKKANDMQVVSSDITKKGTAELAKLADTNNKLTLSNHDYVKQQLIAQGVEGEALTKAMALSDANDKLTASHKTLSKETSSRAKEAAALAKSFDAVIEAANLHNVSLAKTPRELEEATLKSKHYTDAMVKQALALYDIGTALEATKKLHDTEKTELQALTDQYNKLTLSARDYYASTLTSKNIPADAQAPLMAQFDKNAGAEAAKKATDHAKSSLDAYNKSLDTAKDKTSDLGSISSAVFDGALGGISAMAGAFDKMVNSITANSKALDKNAKMQKLNNASADSAEKAANTKRYAEEEIKLNEKITNDKLTGTRQIAGAVSSMLTKGSDAQKAAHAIEVGIAAWQMTQQAFKMAGYIKEGAVWLQLNATKLAGEIEEGATHAAMALGFVAEEEVKGTAAAATAVAVASQSSPWTGFVTGAAMIAAMAAIGFSLMGGSSSQPHVPVSTASPDTGSVLGNATTSSDSVNKTYTLLKDIQAQNYPVLKSIDAGISGLANGISNTITRLYQGGGLSASTANLTPSSSMLQTVITGALGAAGVLSSLIVGPIGLLGPILHFIPVIGPILDSITHFFVNGIFGGDKSYKVTGQGIGTDPTSLSSVRAGNNVNSYQYANIETKTDGGWFGSDSYSTEQQRSGIDSATQKAFNQIFKSIGDTMFGLASALGGDLTQRVNDYVIPAMNVELKGLSGEDAAKKMNGVINTMLDNMAGSVFGDVLGQYQKLGEGMLETAVRIVSQIAVVKDALESSSIKLVDNAIAISDALVNAAGSLKDFQSQFATYFDKFYSDAEKQAKLQTQLSNKLGDVGVSLAASREGYRKQVEAIDITTAAGQAQYSMLLKLAGAADTYYAGVEAAAAAAAAILKTNMGLNQQLTVLTGKQTQTELDRFNALAAVSDESTKTIMRLVYAQQDLNAANAAALTTAKASVTSAMSVLTASVTAERKVITDAYTLSAAAQQKNIDTITASVSKLASISATLKNTLNGMVAPNSEAISRANAQATISASLILAKTGGVGKIDETALNNALGVVSKPSEALFSTFTDYQRDFLSTSNDIADLSNIAGSQLSTGNEQLDAAKATLTTLQDFQAAEMTRLDNIISSAQAQINAINGTTVAVMSISAALVGLASALGGQTLAQTPVQTLKEGLTSTGYQSSAGSSYSAATKNITFTDKTSMSASSVIDYVNTELAAGHPELVYSQAITKGVSAQSLDALMGWTAGTSNAWATKNNLPKFAAGGLHEGGWRIVGENGPELENTGPSRIFSNSQSKSMLNNDELIAEMKALREEVRAGQAAIAANTRQITKILRDVTQDGTSITTTAAA